MLYNRSVSDDRCLDSPCARSSLRVTGSMYLDDDKADVSPALRESVFRNLHAILKHGFDRPLDAVTVGGDITTQGKGEGFRAIPTRRRGGAAGQWSGSRAPFVLFPAIVA